VTGTGVATSVIKTGDILKVDGDSGVVEIVKRAG
jgi:pyruvate,water dikinase